MSACEQDSDINQGARLDPLNRAVVLSHGEVRDLAVSRKATTELARQLITDALANGVIPTATPLSPGVITVTLPDATDARLRTVAAAAGLSVAEASLSLIAQQLTIHRAALDAVERERQAEVDTAEREAAQLDAEAAELAKTIRAPEVKIGEGGGRVQVRFPYCEAASQVVKAIPGALFHGPEHDDKERYWHIAPKYRKRLEAAVPVINELLAREAAKATLLFQAEFTDVHRGVRLRLTWPELRVEFGYDQARVEVMRRLKEQGAAWWNGSVWLVPWGKRDQLKAVLPKLAVTASDDGYRRP